LFITQRQSEVVEQQAVSFNQFIHLLFCKNLFKFAYMLQHLMHFFPQNTNFCLQ
jgi:hypothetical protein